MSTVPVRLGMNINLDSTFDDKENKIKNPQNCFEIMT